MTATPQSLLVLRLSALGDVVHTMPAVALLRGGFPEARIRWVVESPYSEMVRIVAGVEAVPVRLKRWGRMPIASRREISTARRQMRPADASIDFQGLIKSAALGRLSGAPLRYGFSAEAIRERAALVFINRPLDVDTSAHVIDQNLELVRRLAAREPTPAALDWDAFAADPSGRLEQYRGAVVLLPGAGKPNKLWPVARFAELARSIGPRAVTVWGPGEQELAQAVGGRIAPPTSLAELASVLRNASMVIGGDTGPLHLAVAYGRKVIGLYGPTNPRRNGPYGQLKRCVDKYPSTKLMDSITVSEVMTMYERAAAE